METHTLVEYFSQGQQRRSPAHTGKLSVLQNAPPHLTGLRWIDAGTSCANYLFPVLPFVPTLHFLSFQGSWNNFTEPSNLTSFTFWSYYDDINTESFQTFILNNQSLKTQSLECLWFEGYPDGPEVGLGLVPEEVNEVTVVDIVNLLGLVPHRVTAPPHRGSPSYECGGYGRHRTKSPSYSVHSSCSQTRSYSHSHSQSPHSCSRTSSRTYSSYFTHTSLTFSGDLVQKPYQRGLVIVTHVCRCLHSILDLLLCLAADSWSTKQNCK